MKTKNCSKTLILSIFVLFLSCSNASKEEITLNENSIPVIKTVRKSLITREYTFENEGLNLPFYVRYSQDGNEIITYDLANIGFYVFSASGNFIKKIGAAGQGPGEIIHGVSFDMDEKGNIYHFDASNKRITIFTSSGEYLNSFRAEGNEWSKIKITKDRKILVNNPLSGYYLTVYSNDGDFLKNIGEIDALNNLKPVNEMLAYGWIFENSDGNYSIIIESLTLVKTFSPQGKLVQTKDISHVIFPDPKSQEWWQNNKLDVKGLKSPNRQNMFHDIILRQDKFYFMQLTKHDGIIEIFEASKDFDVTRKFLLEVEKEEIGIDYFKLDKLENDFILSLYNNAKIVKYSFTDNN